MRTQLSSFALLGLVALVALGGAPAREAREDRPAEIRPEAVGDQVAQADRVLVGRVVGRKLVPRSARPAGQGSRAEEPPSGDPIELALVEVEHPLVAPASAAPLAVLARRDPADPGSRIEEGQELVLFLLLDGAGSLRLDAPVRDRLSAAVDGARVWRIAEDGAWVVDGAGTVAVPRRFVEEETSSGALPLESVEAAIRSAARARLPFLHVELGLPRWKAWGVTVGANGQLEEFRNPFTYCATGDIEFTRGALTWSDLLADPCVQDFDRRFAARDPVVELGKSRRFLDLEIDWHSPRGRVCVRCGTPFGPGLSRYEDPEERAAVRACLRLVAALPVQHLPDEIRAALDG